MKISVQRLRNLTTKRLHTQMRDIYQDLEMITGESGLMTHMLPGVCDAVLPWLKKHVTEPRFWDGEYNPAHVGDWELPEPTDADRRDMLKRYESGDGSA